ncbi:MULTISPECIES: c-type cytochrome [Zobellia]|uniref:c-type cytochrome n=1 Tax=Zobellia TaxID=112040 RepID=UPI001BFF47AC|nr:MULTISPECIES: c-type cytochrome [Zobellia]MBT9190110.1 c-type cytochrome [Zobellia russellii]MBU2976547.1 c-type cytochrome [Zobellia sp. B3R18]
MIINFLRINKLNLLLCSVLILATSCTSDKKNENETVQSDNPKIAKLKLQPGFDAEHLYSPGDNNMGSWVAMTFDNKGRLITSDQYGALYRMEVAPIGADNLTPKIEKLKIQTEAKVADSIIQMGYAQGLLYAFNSLYVMVNHRGSDDFEKTSGLYRLQDTDNDDQYDKITLLKALDGAGEHGPHSIVLSPDGESLYVIAGNHTDLPEMEGYRLPNNWQDDNLFPQIKDPRGHANDRGAPGGWVANLDPEGKRWELVASGFRNPFDLAFNELGDMFVYDSDMEWDLGMPWYRPTRICHVTSGAEFGWRTGNGKWSAAYPDNVPPVLNIGQGSPTNVMHGNGAKFPEKYQHSVFAFDWSFGIIYAIEMKANGASYIGEKEEFLSGIPLPLTDGVIGPDGAMYFMTGGRRLESDLYRVYYNNPDELTGAAANLEPTKENEIRKKLETYHGAPKDGALDFAWPYLNSKDRFIQYAARIAVEHQPVSTWQEKVYAETNAVRKIHAAVALARQGDKSQRDQLLNSLVHIDYASLSEQNQVDLVRAIELTLARFGKPNADIKRKISGYLSTHYPADTDVLNQLLSKTLVFVDDASVISKTLALLESEEGENASVMANTATDAADLILRNPQYGMDIAETLKNMPLAQHTYYGLVLQDATVGWTPELREKYFKWFYKAFSFKAGRSYIGFIDKARKKALTHVAANKKEFYNQMSGDSLLSKSGNELVSSAVQPKGPGKRWEEKDITPLLADGLQNRNFETGRNMFLATNCVTCHSMRGEGENIGPELSQIGTRFSAEDILKAIIDPSDVISDQYNTTVFMLKDGNSIVGRLIGEEGKNYTVSQNPYAPDVLRTIPKEEVLGTKMSSVSLMPPGTINRLSDDEVKDLLAYLISGGDAENEIFTKE